VEDSLIKVLFFISIYLHNNQREKEPLNMILLQIN